MKFRTDQLWKFALLAVLGFLGVSRAYGAEPRALELKIPVAASMAESDKMISAARDSDQAYAVDLSTGDHGVAFSAGAGVKLAPGRYRLHLMVGAGPGQKDVVDPIELTINAGATRRHVLPREIPKSGPLVDIPVDFVVTDERPVPVDLEWFVGDTLLEVPLREKYHALQNLLKRRAGILASATDAPATAGVGVRSEEAPPAEDLTKDGPDYSQPVLISKGKLPKYRLMFAAVHIETLCPVAIEDLQTDKVAYEPGDDARIQVSLHNFSQSEFQGEITAELTPSEKTPAGPAGFRPVSKVTVPAGGTLNFKFPDTVSTRGLGPIGRLTVQAESGNLRPGMAEGLLVTAPPARKLHPADKKIFAHYMGCWPAGTGPIYDQRQNEGKTLKHDAAVGSPEYYGGHVRNFDLVDPVKELTPEASADLEIRRAMRIGIDGFSVDAWAGGAVARATVDTLFKVAEEKNCPFEITICIDTNSGGDLIGSVKELLEKHGKSTKLARRNGKPLIFGYMSVFTGYPDLLKYAGDRLDRVRAEPVGWQLMGQSLEDAARQIGEPIYFEFCMSSFFYGVDPKLVQTGSLTQAAGILARYADAIGSFTWLGPEQPEVCKAVHAAGAEWSMPVGMFQKENIPYECYVPKGTDYMHWGQGAIDQDSTLIQLITWNDYGENTCIAPAWNTRYTLYDLVGHEIKLWKTGKEPAPDHDRVYLIYRKYPAGAKIFPFHAMFGGVEPGVIEIAQHCLMTNGLNDTFKTASCIALDTLTNTPAISLALRRGLVPHNFGDDIPMPLKMDWMNRAVRYSIVLNDRDKTIIHANKFQRMFWDDVEENDWLSVSAPTSAGKSFLLVNWLAEYLRDRSGVGTLAVYVVPTRALIQQVQLDLESHFHRQGPSNSKVSCLPLPSQLNAAGPTIFVLTQERLHILLNNLSPKHSIDLVVVDEAHKIGDGARGVLLQIVLESVLSHNRERTKFVFASPTTANPELLLQDAPKGVRKKELRSDQVTVCQNLIWVSRAPNTESTWLADLIFKGERIRLGEVDVPFRMNTKPKRLAFVAYAMSQSGEQEGGGNLVYVNGAAEAETVALLLHDVLGKKADVRANKAVAELILLVQKVIHDKYSLAVVLERGVAFHYGNMPLLIRNEIERLFRENILRFLVCTSTLVEGVNLPAKSIFVRGPQKGQGKPMNDADFWNLAGRAGRLGKEFQGNIVCIDPDDRTAWPEPPPVERKGQQIERTTDVILERADQFFTYLDGDVSQIDRERRAECEHVLGYLYGHVLRSGSLRDSKIAERYPPLLIARLDLALSKIKDVLRTPRHIIERNPGINPLAMDRLLKYFELRTGPVEELIPSLPENEDAAESLMKVFYRINKYVSPVFGSGKRVQALAILVVNWMRGQSLARIISKREELQPSTSLAQVIRSSMEDVERVARFLAPKYVSCYIDVLRQFLNMSGRTEMAANVPDLTLWMEFGASAKTQLSLMSLGLSRTSAILISEIIADDKLDEEACLLWLEDRDSAALGLPSLVVQEIERLQGKNADPDGGSGHRPG